jgi:hypothetical protein
VGTTAEHAEARLATLNDVVPSRPRPLAITSTKAPFTLTLTLMLTLTLKIAEARAWFPARPTVAVVLDLDLDLDLTLAHAVTHHTNASSTVKTATTIQLRGMMAFERNIVRCYAVFPAQLGLDFKYIPPPIISMSDLPAEDVWLAF